MKKDSIQTYSYRISQASRTDLIVILYDMAMEYIRDAKEALQVQDTLEFTKNIRQAKRVVDELGMCLDMQYDISKELLNIYLYAGRVLVKALATGSDENLERVEKLFTGLRKSFYELSKTDDSGPMIQNAQQVYAGLTYSNVGSSNEISNNYTPNRGYTV